MRLGMLTQWYDPEPGPAALPGVLARGLAGRGHRVNVVTGFPNYPTGKLAEGYTLSRRRDEFADGVGVRRVALYPSHDGSFARRLANYGSFGLSAAVSGMGFVRGADALWVNYSPVTVAPAMWLSRYRDGIPLVVHVADLWPDTMFAGGFGPGGRAGAAARAALHAWCDAMYASAQVVTYISPGVRELLRERGVPGSKLAYAPMWADESVFAPADAATRAAGQAWRRELGIGDEDVLLLYAGALGEAQGLQTLVRAVLAASHPRLRCVIAGSGTAEPALRALAAHLGGQDPQRVRFIGRVATSAMPVLMAGADACYVGLSRDRLSAVTMPSKTQAAMAAGRTLVVAADGDVQYVTRQARAGFATSSGDTAGLARILDELCESGRAALESTGRAGREYYEANFSAERAVDRALAALATAGREGRRA